jgi:hypothetical protein
MFPQDQTYVLSTLAPGFRVCQQCSTSLPLLVERAPCDSLGGIRKDEQHKPVRRDLYSDQIMNPDSFLIARIVL